VDDWELSQPDADGVSDLDARLAFTLPPGLERRVTREQ
jgi:hypothetical protein